MAKWTIKKTVQQRLISLFIRLIGRFFFLMSFRCWVCFIFVGFLFYFLRILYIFYWFGCSLIRFVGILHHMMSMRLSIRINYLNHTSKANQFFFCCDFAHLIFTTGPYTDLRRPIPLIRCARNIGVAHKWRKRATNQHVYLTNATDEYKNRDLEFNEYTAYVYTLIKINSQDRTVHKRWASES